MNRTTDSRRTTRRKLSQGKDPAENEENGFQNIYPKKQGPHT